MRRQVRLRCAESANPQSCAASVHDDPPIAALTADPTRAQSTWARKETPVWATNRCRNRLGDRRATRSKPNTCPDHPRAACACGYVTQATALTHLRQKPPAVAIKPALAGPRRKVAVAVKTSLRPQ